MQTGEKTRENQFVQPNTVPVALAILMNFYFSLPRSFVCLSFVPLFSPLLISLASKRLQIFPGGYAPPPLAHRVHREGARRESREVGSEKPLKRYTPIRQDGRSANYVRRVLLYRIDDKKRCDSYSTGIFK